MKHPIGSITAALALSAGLLGTDLLGDESVSGQSVGPNLERALRETGWSVEQLTDGGLKLHIARTVAPQPTPKEPPRLKMPLTEAAAWGRLRERGWRVERAVDGSLLLFPGEKDSDIQSLEESSAAPASAAAPWLDTRVRNTQKEPELSEEIDELLRQRGWRANRASDGSLLVYPLAGGHPSR